MAKNFDEMEDSNTSANTDIHTVSDPARRLWMQGGIGLAIGALLAPMAGCAAAGAARGGPRIGFKAVPASAVDAVVVPEGYVTQVLAPWGEPVGIAGAAMPAWRDDAGNTAEEQALQMGMHHDGMHFFALDGSRRGLLVMNHEYTDDGLLHPDGMRSWTADKVRKAQAAHGISVIEIVFDAGQWRVVRPSPWARRITAQTPFALGGPAAGHRLMRTAADPAGQRVLGTFNNCAAGKTPWGTYLAGEENFRFYFSGGERIDADQSRWGMVKAGFFRWAEHDDRFDATKHPHEFHRFGWIVEIDPMDPTATPVKRTAMGRAAHEGAWVATTRDGRAVVYSGEDSRFEYIYKFVSRDRIAPAGNGFADQGEVVIKARQASDALGATKMDRPEWLAIDQAAGEVYCTLTNNNARGTGNNPGVDAANPRANNVMGQIIRWKETGDFDATTLRWNHLLLAGDPANARPEAKGNIRGDIFACPDGLMLDARGVLWIQTDAAAYEMRKGELQNIGNNQMLACDPATGEVRRFLTGPVNCELTGSTMAPDGRTLFVNIQHPGETPSERSDAAEPAKFSNWPDAGRRPRSATVVIRRADGGLVGT